MYKIMIVEDDRSISEMIKNQTQQWGFDAFCARNFRNILQEFTEYNPHLILMDVSLPFFNGYHWCTQIRQVSKIPIIFISSVSDNMNIIMAINMGADDFVAKPFDTDVLIAKIQALLRRSYDFVSTTPFLEHNGALLNTGDGTLTYNNETIPLSKNEYCILRMLLESKGKIVSREKLIEKLWKSESFVDENTLTVNINRLRKKLENAGLDGFIATKHGMGYIINTESEQ